MDRVAVSASYPRSPNIAYAARPRRTSRFARSRDDGHAAGWRERDATAHEPHAVRGGREVDAREDRREDDLHLEGRERHPEAAAAGPAARGGGGAGGALP